MKVFQKVKSPVNGTVKKIIAENETALADDDLMFIIEKSKLKVIRGNRI